MLKIFELKRLAAEEGSISTWHGFLIKSDSLTRAPGQWVIIRSILGPLASALRKSPFGPFFPSAVVEIQFGSSRDHRSFLRVFRVEPLLFWSFRGSAKALTLRILRRVNAFQYEKRI